MGTDCPYLLLEGWASLEGPGEQLYAEVGEGVRARLSKPVDVSSDPLYINVSWIGLFVVPSAARSPGILGNWAGTITKSSVSHEEFLLLLSADSLEP